MYRCLVVLLATAIACDCHAQQSELTPQDKRMMGGCAILGFKMSQSRSAFPPEWLE